MSDVLTTRTEGGILEVTLDRPKANAIDLNTSRQMGEIFQGFRDDPELLVAIIKTAGDKFFCAGWDLKAAADGDAVDGGYRGEPRADISATVKAILAIQEYAISHSNSLIELEVNPLLIGAQGKGVFAADALIVLGAKINV